MFVLFILFFRMPKKNTNTSSKPKKRKPVYKFDMKKILKERLAEKERNPAFYEKLRNINLVVPAEIKNTNVDEGLPTLEHTIIDFSNYNIPFNDITDLKQSCLQRLHVLSIEQNEIVANIHFNILMKANWSPVLKVRTKCLIFSFLSNLLTYHWSCKNNMYK